MSAEPKGPVCCCCELVLTTLSETSLGGRFAPSIFRLMTSSGGWPRMDPSIPFIWSGLAILHAHKVGYRADTFSIHS